MRASILFLLCISAPGALAQYKLDGSGDAPPSGLPPAIAGELQGTGSKVVSAGGQQICEVWFVKKAPAGKGSTETDVTLSAFPAGALLGAIQFPAKGNDRRGQVIQAGTYLLRYVIMPVNGAHLGAAPQRDFAALVPVAADPGISAALSVDDTVALSTKVSGTSHPAILSLATGSGTAGFTKEGEHDWTLNTTIGGTAVAVILLGKAEN